MKDAKRSTARAVTRQKKAATEQLVRRGSRRGAREDRLAMLYCPNCSQRLESRSCRLRCNRCGYFMDCSDYC